MERLWFSLLLLAAACRGQPCPKRCMCQSLSPSLAILCSKTGLLFVPAAIDRRTVELRLQRTSSCLAHLSLCLFCSLTAVRKKDFANMTSLLHLTLSRNTISQILPSAFSDLRRLRALHLDSNRLTVIKDDHFKGLTNLRHLILANNQLHSISPHAFDDFLSTLEDLDLSYNNLAQEFICDPPVLTRKSPHTVAMEGQPASLKCKANGDPEPEVHWISPEGRLISNSSSTSRSRDPSSEPAPSDILTSSKVALPNNETRGIDRRVSLVELTGNSALIRWSSQTPMSGVRMFQVQYNSSGDDTLVY
ncbi:hypothetical protein INR49_018592, partial [Caranx melampygus]